MDLIILVGLSGFALSAIAFALGLRKLFNDHIVEQKHAEPSVQPGFAAPEGSPPREEQELEQEQADAIMAPLSWGLEEKACIGPFEKLNQARRLEETDR